MNITDILDKSAISVDVKAKDKQEVLSELVDLITQSGNIKKTDKLEILKRLQEREILGSTGMGKGVAIPHAKSPCVKNLSAALGISKKGVDFKSLDGEPAYIFFLLLAPGENPGPHLKALAKISRLLDDKFVRDRLISADTNQKILDIIQEEEAKRS